MYSLERIGDLRMYEIFLFPSHGIDFMKNTIHNLKRLTNYACL